MAKSIVFVLHGVGEYGSHWIEDDTSAVQGLKKVVKRYEFFQSHSLDSYVEFVPILYDDVFEQILKSWSDQARALEAIPIVPAYVERVAEFVGGFGEEKWWLKTGLDVALYWGFRLIQRRVVLRVLSQMTERIAEARRDSTEYSFHVLAHSLGTAVAHDALHHLGTERWLRADGGLVKEECEGASYMKAINSLKEVVGVSNPFHPRLFGFESITMLSNVSVLLQVSENPYASIVRPGSARDDNAYTRVFINVDHKQDPISILGNFRVPFGWKPGGLNLQLNHLDGPIENIHDASHYVAHPFVHLRLFNQYVDPFAVGDTDVEKALKYDREKVMSEDELAHELTAKLKDKRDFGDWFTKVISGLTS